MLYSSSCTRASAWSFTRLVLSACCLLIDERYLRLSRLPSLSYFFFLMIRRPPRSTLFPLHDALPICKGWHRPVRWGASIECHGSVVTEGSAAGSCLSCPVPRTVGDSDRGTACDRASVGTSEEIGRAHV